MENKDEEQGPGARNPQSMVACFHAIQLEADLAQQQRGRDWRVPHAVRELADSC